MLNLAKFPTQAQHTKLLHNPISLHLQTPSKTHLPFPTPLNSHPVLRNGLFCNAAKTKKRGAFTSTETDGPDEFENDFDDEFFDLADDDGEFEEGGDVDDDDEVVIPLKNMKRWVENRPRGFGEGKVYDTSIEDELMEEIEQSRIAQLANVNKLKNSPVRPNSVKESSKQDKGSTQIQDGFHVRLVNLPKKKNIHRDLRMAFKEVPGILNIVPIVSGNEKTRDPVCKGLALIHFKHQKEAERFVENFSGKSISFGKVQKQIKCELMSLKLPKPASDQSLAESYRDPQNAPTELEYTDERHVLAEWEDDEEMNGTSTISESNSAEELISVGEDSSVHSSSMNKIRELKTNKKKVASKKKKDKVPKGPKLNIPGSANRLKIREKEMLTGVFSKYGANATLTVKEQSR